MHLGNVLHFGENGWLAIDPKQLLEGRFFDYANLLCNRPLALQLAAFSSALASFWTPRDSTAPSCCSGTLAWAGACWRYG
ncbi:aminoglycoside phosphotransferase family protein [Cupriavidus taiwanensis]|uniref:aminoglycoside phosphotransferase family protein n=1 Tax=Cupriavidus taiwanensis TaxID=164546 RepID=UPI002163767B|nr:aminoglycoside phosphotransferase family protein [Cupriavidus taiwanensis]